MYACVTTQNKSFVGVNINMHNSAHVHIVYLLPGSCPVIVKPSISEIQSSSSGQFSLGLLNQGQVKTLNKMVEYIGQQDL